MASKDPSFIDVTIDILTAAFRHDKYSRKQLKLQVESNTKTNIYQSNSINLILQANRFLAQSYHLKDTVQRLKDGKLHRSVRGAFEKVDIHCKCLQGFTGI
jgi:hypothetical protein